MYSVQKGITALLLAVIISPHIALGQATAATADGVVVSSVAAAGTTQASSEPARFVVPIDSTIDTVAASLKAQGYIKDSAAFITLWNKNKNPKKSIITPGAYKIPAKSSNIKIASMLRRPPYMKWVIIPPGLRKEEVAELLTTTLGWSASEKTKWISTYTALKYDYREGVFWPDTYLIPVSEKPIDVAKRITRKFDENFAPYLIQFNERNIPWTKGLSLASLVQREAASIDEMPLIAGILYNRIDEGMPLGIDASIQYIRGDTGHGWWAPLSKDDLKLKQADSKLNTYKHSGTPPQPIASPGREAIDAVLNPADTDCLYYLHDKTRTLRCSRTYDEHKQAISTYLTS